MVTTPVRGTYLDRILENTLTELTERNRSRPLSQLDDVARSMPEPGSFQSALRQQDVTVIAEIKRASPSKGSIAPGIDATKVAREYIEGGASAISVLTDETFFGGSLDDLRDVAAIAGERAIPVLRKDFVLDVYQIVEARAMGAAAALLIVAALSDDQLRELLSAAAAYGVDALVEVHDEGELERALAAGAAIVGVNNRDLRTFNVDLSTTERVATRVPSHVTLVGESGIRTREDVQRLGKAGAHAVLVGEALMRAPDRVAALRELLS